MFESYLDKKINAARGLLPKKKPQQAVEEFKEESLRENVDYLNSRGILEQGTVDYIQKDILKDRAPTSFAYGGLTTPKRGLVDGPGSYSYSGLINEIDNYLGDPSKSPSVDINDIVEKFKIGEKYKGKQYDQKISDIKKQLIKRGYTLKTIKISPAVEYALSKSGIKVGQKNFKEANVKKLQNLYEIIEKYNAMSDISMPLGTGEKFKLADISEKKLFEEAGYGKGAKRGKLPVAKYLIDNYFLTTQDKMNAELTKMLADDSTKLTDALGWTNRFSKKYNKPLKQVNQIVRDLPIYKQNKDLLNKLTHPQSVQKFSRNKDIDVLQLGDFADYHQNRINFSMKSFSPEQQLQSYAYKHSFNRGGKEIEWITNPHKTPQSEWVFKYKGKIYDGDDLALSRKDPNFAKFWKTDDQIKNYLDFKITDPEVLKKLGFKKPTTMETIMKRALGAGTGSKGYFFRNPMVKDHVDISSDPFDVRPMNSRINMGEGDLKKRLLNKEITRAQYDQGIKKIGYEYMGGLNFDDPNTFDSVIKRDLDFAVKAGQREKGFLRTPTDIVKSKTEIFEQAMNKRGTKVKAQTVSKLAQDMNVDICSTQIVKKSGGGRIGFKGKMCGEEFAKKQPEQFLAQAEKSSLQEKLVNLKDKNPARFKALMKNTGKAAKVIGRSTFGPLGLVGGEAIAYGLTDWAGGKMGLSSETSSDVAAWWNNKDSAREDIYKAMEKLGYTDGEQAAVNKFLDATNSQALYERAKVARDSNLAQNYEPISGITQEKIQEIEDYKVSNAKQKYDNDVESMFKNMFIGTGINLKDATAKEFDKQIDITSDQAMGGLRQATRTSMQDVDPKRYEAMTTQVNPYAGPFWNFFTGNKTIRGLFGNERAQNLGMAEIYKRMGQFDKANEIIRIENEKINFPTLQSKWYDPTFEVPMPAMQGWLDNTVGGFGKDTSTAYGEYMPQMMAGGGIASIRRPNAIPPEKGPLPQGLENLRYYVT